jgi:hypothetical protein
MPRGNDAEAAASELADKFSAGKGNAEELIDANNAAHPLEVIQASGKKVDDEATKEAYDKLVGTDGGPNGEEILDVAVRGGATIIVYEDENDRMQKSLLDDGSGSKGTSKASKKRNAKAKATDTADAE